MSLSNSFNNAATGDSALMDAVKNGNAEIVKKLLELGVDINIHVPSSGAMPIPGSAIPMPVPTASAPPAREPEKRKKAVVTKMATERQVAAPQTARFRKKSPPKRQTSL